MKRSKIPRRALKIMALSVLIAVPLLLGAVAFYAPPFLVLWDRDAANTNDADAAVSAARQAVLWAAGGLIAIIALVFTWRRDRTATETLRVGQDANLTSRFTEAIAQLGDSKNIAIRLGGTYALERIALDSPRDRQTILDVLSANLRAMSPRMTYDSDEKTLPIDYLASIEVIGRISSLRLGGRRIELHSSNLNGARLDGADLTNANFQGSCLEGGTLVGVEGNNANFIEATLTEANLREAQLKGAIFSNANLTQAALSNADLSDATLERAVLVRARLLSVNLRNAEMDGANFTLANLFAANLTGVSLEDAKLQRATLRKAILHGARLVNADLTGARLEGADLTNADLLKANLTDARLERADLSGSDLTHTVFTGARWSSSTKWPDGFTPPGDADEVDDAKPAIRFGRR